MSLVFLASFQTYVWPAPLLQPHFAWSFTFWSGSRARVLAILGVLMHLACSLCAQAADKLLSVSLLGLHTDPVASVSTGYATMYGSFVTVAQMMDLRALARLDCSYILCSVSLAAHRPLWLAFVRVRTLQLLVLLPNGVIAKKVRSNFGIQTLQNLNVPSIAIN
jgi:hypothetical protein